MIASTKDITTLVVSAMSSSISPLLTSVVSEPMDASFGFSAKTTVSSD